MNKKNLQYVFIIIFLIILWLFLLLKYEKIDDSSKNGTWTIIDKWVNNVENTTNIDSIDTNDKKEKNLLQDYISWHIWNIKCVFDTDQEWVKSKQYVYITWQKVRMDMTVISDTENTESHIINDWFYSYIWWNGTAMKVKNVVSEKNVESDNTNDSSKDIKSYLETITYNNCSEWTVDNKMFELPSWIDFTDFEELQKNIMNEIPSQELIDEMMKKYDNQ